MICRCRAVRILSLAGSSAYYRPQETRDQRSRPGADAAGSASCIWSIRSAAAGCCATCCGENAITLASITATGHTERLTASRQMRLPRTSARAGTDGVDGSRVTHRAAHSCPLHGAVSGAVDNPISAKPHLTTVDFCPSKRGHL